MIRPFNLVCKLLLPVMLILPVVPSEVLAQDHVVATSDLRAELRSTAQERQQNIAKLRAFLSSDTAQSALRAAKLDPAKARNAVAMMSDQELARLSAQLDRTDFAGAGISLTNQQVTYIIIGVIAIAIIAIIASR